MAVDKAVVQGPDARIDVWAAARSSVLVRVRRAAAILGESAGTDEGVVLRKSMDARLADVRALGRYYK